MMSMMTLAIISGLIAGGVTWFAWGLLENINAVLAQRRWARAKEADALHESLDLDAMETEDVDTA